MGDGWRLVAQEGGWWLVQAGEAEAQDGRDWGRYIAGVDSRYSREGKGPINRDADLQQSHLPHRLSH